jgi:hypothetical protein
VNSAGKIQSGSVVWAEVAEPDGVTPAGEHPSVVLNKQAEIDAGIDLRVVVCSTSFDFPLPSGWFIMPTQPGGHPRTGLAEACVVKATWPAIIPQSAVRKVSPERIPTTLFRQILNWLRDHKPLP